jgi:2-polyprenyl-6-methoxyphenol hydroxylase-like FAD-dependent oxidoreductase
MSGSVVIVGGGPGGACLAFVMAQAGLKVSLMERQTDFSREFRGEQIMDSGINALKTMGIWDKMTGLKTLRMNSSELFVDRKLQFGLSDPGSELGALYLPQPPFLKLVLDEAAKFPNFTFHPKTSALSLIEEGGRVVGVVAKNGDGEKVDLRADMVICADGRFSQMRAKAGLESTAPKDSENYDVVWCRLSAPPRLAKTGTSQMYIGDKTFAFALVTPDDDVSVGWMIDKGNFTTYKKVGENEWLDQLLELVSPEMADHMRTHQSEIKHALLNVVCYNTEKWWKPGLLLVGDAAHPMSPAAGQGITMALRDGIMATNLLAPLLKAGAPAAAIDAACAKIQAERSKEIDLVQTIQRKMSAVMSQRNFAGRLLMRYIMPAMGKRFPGLLAASTAGPKSLRYGTTVLNLEPSLRKAA